MIHYLQLFSFFQGFFALLSYRTFDSLPVEKWSPIIFQFLAEAVIIAISLDSRPGRISQVELPILFQFSYSKIGSFRKVIDAILLKVPVVGHIIQNYELSRFSYILALMLDSGVSYAQAVQLASTTFNNLALRDLFNKASAKVVEGNKLSVALVRTNGVKPKRNFMQSLALGEESSSVASILKSIANLYNEENKDRIKVLLSLMEPFMMLFIGGIVGTIVLAMLLPIFSMSLGAKH